MPERYVNFYIFAVISGQLLIDRARNWGINTGGVSMSVISQIKGAGSVVLGIVIMLGMSAIGIGMLMGAAAFSIWVLKWTFPVFSITFVAAVVILLPLSFIPAARGFSAAGFVFASFVFGAILWLWGMGYTYSVWGLLGVIVGLVIFGVGVVPVAMLAALLHGDWSNLGMFILAGIITFGCRGLAGWLAEKADERAANPPRSKIVDATAKVFD